MHSETRDGMPNPYLSLRFTVFLSLSLAASSSSPSLFSKPSHSPSSSSPIFASRSSPQPSPRPRATATDLLSVLGPPSQSSSINPVIAQELRSCLKFVVPFTPTKPRPGRKPCSVNQRLCWGERDAVEGHREEEENELVWWPPNAVLELARLAVDSGGDPDSIHRALDPAMIPVPDVEGSKEDRCELTRTPYGRRFIGEELNAYFEYLFELIVARGPAVGLNVTLSRYDLFHGHMFIAFKSGRIGILFHAKEYPAYDKEVFPYNMGYCQRGSDVTFDDSMDLRNILWLAPLPGNSTKEWLAPGVLVVLDAHPGGIIYKDIIPEYVQFARTIYEDDLGKIVVDVKYLNVGKSDPDFQLFFC